MARNFPKGNIYHVEFTLDDPWWLEREQVYGVRRAGQLYEERVHTEFLKRYPGYVPSPWLHFHDSQGEKWCQPDGLIVDPVRGLMVAVEVKLRHTNDACVSLFGVYKPVLEALFRGLYKVEVVEVCQWYDVSTYCDRPAKLAKWPNNPHEGEFNVHIYRG